MQRCIASGLNIVLAIVGDGRQRANLERLASRLGIVDRIQFLGMLPAGQAIRDELDRSDLFILPSRTEGLPRAMIEAMARGLPCIGSTAGGIPELLAEEDMVRPGDAIALGMKIIEVVSSLERRRAMATRNLGKAKEFDGEVLRERRIQFYQYVRGFMERSSSGQPNRECYTF
jgi:glycosyltransferase involved in cell wall biosynthesis